MNQDFLNARFHSAVKYGNTTLAKVFLKLGANIRSNSDKAIVTAVENGDVNMVRFLLTNGADVANYQDLVNRASLAPNGAAMIRLLVNRGASFNTWDSLFMARVYALGGDTLVNFLKYANPPTVVRNSSSRGSSRYSRSSSTRSSTVEEPLPLYTTPAYESRKSYAAPRYSQLAHGVYITPTGSRSSSRKSSRKSSKKPSRISRV